MNSISYQTIAKIQLTVRHMFNMICYLNINNGNDFLYYEKDEEY